MGRRGNRKTRGFGCALKCAPSAAPKMRAVGGPETAQKKLKRMLGKDDGDGDGGGDGGGRCLPLPRREGRMAARPGQ